ncbi:MAG TPA: LLM class flavin-dependent oxidoreductase [Chloroflexota bacterium]|jgi:natural product biosynthesis luciferase-like monooxygenase protein
MRFGAHYNPTYVPALDGAAGEFYRRMFEQIELLDALGFDDAWVTEHHFTDYGGWLPHPPTFLAAVARTTRRIHLGVAVSVLPLHNPLQVAEEYAMVDVISGGRLEFGVGRGSTLGDFHGLGVDVAKSTTAMKEATELIRAAWSGERITHHGALFDYTDLQVLPRPPQRPHPPIWVGASRSDDTYRWAGEQGFHLMTLPYMYDPAEIRQALAHYREALVAAGHDPATREVLGKFHVYVAETNEAAQREAEPYLEHYEASAASVIRRPSHQVPPSTRRTRDRDYFTAQIAAGNIIAGDPDRCVDVIRHWRDSLGLTCLSGTFHFGGMPQELALRNVRLFAEQVMPAFRDGAAPAAGGVAPPAARQA